MYYIIYHIISQKDKSFEKRYFSRKNAYTCGQKCFKDQK